MKNTAKYIAVNAVVAALYIVFTMPFATIATGPIQFRPAEALTVLPALMPYTVVGLTIGCAVSNLVSAFGIFDVLLGSLTTLVAGLLTATVCRKFWSAPIPPVVLNALFLPLIWMLSGSEVMYFTEMLYLLLSQSVVIFGLGIPLYFLTEKKLLPVLNKE